jgi:hypothetical protein
MRAEYYYLKWFWFMLILVISVINVSIIGAINSVLILASNLLDPLHPRSIIYHRYRKRNHSYRPSNFSFTIREYTAFFLRPMARAISAMGFPSMNKVVNTSSSESVQGM